VSETARLCRECGHAIGVDQPAFHHTCSRCYYRTTEPTRSRPPQQLTFDDLDLDRDRYRSAA
jgi:hypothetical protein